MEHWNADPEEGNARLAVDAVPQFKVGNTMGGGGCSKGWEGGAAAALAQPCLKTTCTRGLKRTSPQAAKPASK